jgi:DnaK suppressor protein
MTQTDKEQIRDRIVSELARVREDVEALTALTQPVVFEDMDDITHMNAIVNKSVNEAALASSRKRLAGLEYALKRLDDPEFGYCTECGEPIPRARLLSMPEASRCVNCAE